MNLEYTIDLDGLDFVKAVTNYSSLVDHRLAHRDKLSLKIRFTRAGVCQDIGDIPTVTATPEIVADAGAYFTVKKINEPSEVLSDSSSIKAWKKVTSGTDTYYTPATSVANTPTTVDPTGVVDLDTVELETWIGSQQTCKAEVQFTWKVGTQVYHSRLLKTTIERALLPSTGIPALASTVASEMGVVNLGNAALSGTVTFAGTFASAPTKIFLNVEISASGGSPTGTSTLIWANYHSVTTTEFKWELSGATGDANHKLVWWAIR